MSKKPKYRPPPHRKAPDHGNMKGYSIRQSPKGELMYNEYLKGLCKRGGKDDEKHHTG